MHKLIVLKNVFVNVFKILYEMFNTTFVHEQCGCHPTTWTQAWEQFQTLLV